MFFGHKIKQKIQIRQWATKYHPTTCIFFIPGLPDISYPSVVRQPLTHNGAKT